MNAVQLRHLSNTDKMSKTDDAKSSEKIEEIARVPYQQFIGSLMHLALYTRLDIMHAVTKLSQFNANPSRAHLGHRQSMYYVIWAKDYALLYQARQTPIIWIHSDADWAGDIDDRHSYTILIWRPLTGKTWYNGSQ